MVTLATKLVFITVLAMQFFMVVSLQSKELLMTKDLVHVLNQKTTEYNLKQSMTNVYLITSPAAKRLRSKFSFLNKPHEKMMVWIYFDGNSNFFFNHLMCQNISWTCSRAFNRSTMKNMPLELLDWVDTFLILKFFSLVHNFWIIKFPIWCTLCTVHIADLDLTGNFGQSKFSTQYKTLVIDTLFTTDTKFVSTRSFRIIEKSVEETQFHTQVKKNAIAFQ